jgi:beta-galactosidase
MTESERHVFVHPHGLRLRALDGSEKVIPLCGGAMHYFRHDPADWPRGLDAMKAMGLSVVDIYVPWGVHETARERFDFGSEHAWLNVREFVRLCAERDLYVVLRPGPHINAELTYFGLPERIVWTDACQARTPKGNPVMLPMVPLAFPVPSYASDVFHEETARWFEAVGREVADLQYPHGPIVLLQVDNEGALYFRDGPYDQDYHPDAVRQFREYLREKYTTVHALRTAWNDTENVQFATVLPPTQFAAECPEDLVRHLDWTEFHEELLSSALRRFAEALAVAGFRGVPTMHNMPLGESATALNPKRLGRAIDIVALDYYHHANPSSHAILVRRTTELASRCEGSGQPAYGAEMGAGYPPFFAPLDEFDSVYTLLAALAYGLRGFSLYMAVDRDRWVGAPIDAHGVPRALADTYRRIFHMLARTGFYQLKRRTPVRLVMPRTLRRLARVAHAFGPVTPAAFNISGATFHHSCFEEHWGLGESPMAVAEEYLRSFERALQARGVPYAYVGGESLAESVDGAQWVIAALAGGIKPSFLEALRALQKPDRVVTVGPRIPSRDGSMQTLATASVTCDLELEPLLDRADVERLVAKRIDEMHLPCITAMPEHVYVTVHDGMEGPALVFVMNPTTEKRATSISVPGALALRDALFPDFICSRSLGAFALDLEPRTVRVFEVVARAPVVR